MTRRLIAASALLILSALTLDAQDMPPGKWWRRQEVVQRLAITDEQQTRLDAVFRNAANELIDAKAEVEKQNVALRGELDQPQLSRERIQRVAARLSEARARLFERELMMLVEMRGVLSGSQWSRLRTMLDARAEHQRPDGQRNRPRPPGKR